MFRNWKRNLVLLALLVLIGTAGFLNWKYSGAEAQAADGKVLGQSTLVSGENGSAGAAVSTAASGESDEASGDESGVYAGSDYFASARLTRQQARDNAIALLQEAAAKQEADQSVQDQASEGIQVLAGYTMTEAQIENLVTAKGYTDCVAFMGDESVSVVVDSGGRDLTAEDVAKIKDIAVSETGYSTENVRIMAAN